MPRLSEGMGVVVTSRDISEQRCSIYLHLNRCNWVVGTGGSEICGFQATRQRKRARQLRGLWVDSYALEMEGRVSYPYNLKRKA